MRKIYDAASGADNTSTAVAALKAGRKLVTAYLYRWEFMDFVDYNPYGRFCSFTFTDAAWPIFVQYYQIGAGGAQQIGTFPGSAPEGFTFTPEAFHLDKLSYGIGLDDRPAEVTWTVKDSIDYPYGFDFNPFYVIHHLGDASSPSHLTMKQAFAMGLFSEAPFWIHQAVYTDFPNQGGTFLGTALMFRGAVRGVTATRSKMKIQLASLMDVFHTIKVPTQTLTPQSRALPYIPVATSLYGGDFSSPTVLGLQVIQFSTTESIPANAMQDSWVIFNPAVYAAEPSYQSGTPSAVPFRIQGNSASTGSSVTVYFYDTVVVPVSFAAITVYAQPSATAAPSGFLYVPMPEYSA